MKTKWYISVLAGLMLFGTAQAQYNYEDDIYYDPTQKPVFQQKAAVSKTVTKKVYTTTPSGRDVDEYNRREHTESVIDEELAYIEDPTLMDTLETGQPFEYSERIRRFHNKKFNTHITDGAYLNIYVEDAGYSDVNIYYIDGYSNAWMSPLYYDSYYYPRNGWSLNNWYRDRWNVYYDPWTYNSWGYYDPWFSVQYHNNFWYDPWWGYSGYRPLYPYGYDPYTYGYYQGYNDGYYDRNYGGYYGGYYGQRRSNRVLSTSQRDFVSRVGSGLSSRSRTISGGRVMSSANSRTMSNSGISRTISTDSRNASTINSNRSGIQSVSRSATLNSNNNVSTQSRSTQPSIYTRTTRSASTGTNNQVIPSSNGSVSTPTRSQTINNTVRTPASSQSTNSTVTTPTRSQTTTTVIRPASSSQTTPSSTSISRSSSTNNSTPSTTTSTRSSTSTSSSSSSSRSSSSSSSSSGSSRTSTISGGRR